MRHGQQHTSARKARKRAQGQGVEHHRCQVPKVQQQQEKREKVATPATECEVELLEGRRTSAVNSRPKDEFERTQVTKTEDEKERGRPSPRHQVLAW